MARVLQAEAEVAVRTVLAACRACEAVRTSLVLNQAKTKEDKSPVTVADFAAQALVVDALGKAFPDDPVVGEEDAEALRGDAPEATALRGKVVETVKSIEAALTEDAILAAIDRGNYAGGAKGRFWALDPIDGTKGFLRNDQYAIALGLIVDGEPVLGVLGCPNLPVDLSKPEGPRGCVFLGTKGEGCVQFTVADPDAKSPAKVLSTSSTTEATVVESVESGHTAHDISSKIMAQLGISKPSVRMDSQAKYAALARGDGDVYLRLPRPGKRYEEKIWDHAAGLAVIEAAGGTVTDVNGLPLNFKVGRTLKENTGVIATNGPMHADVVKAVQAAMAAEAEAAAAK